MNIDIKRLRVDADYWAAVAPEWGTDRYTPCPVEPAPSNPMNDNCPAARIGEIGNQVHNLGCDYQNDEDLSDELGQVAVTLWDLAKKVASLDQAQREREEIIKAAIEACPYPGSSTTHIDVEALYEAGMLRRAVE